MFPHVTAANARPDHDQLASAKPVHSSELVITQRSTAHKGRLFKVADCELKYKEACEWACEWVCE